MYTFNYIVQIYRERHYFCFPETFYILVLKKVIKLSKLSVFFNNWKKFLKKVERTNQFVAFS